MRVSMSVTASVLSLAMVASTSLAQQITTTTTTTTTSTHQHTESGLDGSVQPVTISHAHNTRQRSTTTTAPDGSQMTTTHDVSNRSHSVATPYSDPAVAGKHVSSRSTTVTAPNGASRTTTESHSTSSTSTPPQR